MRVEYNVTFEDFAASMKAWRKVSRLVAVSYYLRMWVFPAMGAFLILLWAALAYSSGKSEAMSWIVIPIVGLVFLILMPAAHHRMLRWAYKARTSQTKDGNAVMDFNEEEVVFSIPNGTSVRYPWKAFTAYNEGPRVATLFSGKAAFHTIPRRAMPETEWQEFRALVARHGERS